jgi:hypothetical protein
MRTSIRSIQYFSGICMVLGQKIYQLFLCMLFSLDYKMQILNFVNIFVCT